MLTTMTFPVVVFEHIDCTDDHVTVTLEPGQLITIWRIENPNVTLQELNSK